MPDVSVGDETRNSTLPTVCEFVINTPEYCADKVIFFFIFYYLNSCLFCRMYAFKFLYRFQNILISRIGSANCVLSRRENFWIMKARNIKIQILYFNLIVSGAKEALRKFIYSETINHQNRRTISNIECAVKKKREMGMPLVRCRFFV